MSAPISGTTRSIPSIQCSNFNRDAFFSFINEKKPVYTGKNSRGEDVKIHFTKAGEGSWVSYGGDARIEPYVDPGSWKNEDPHEASWYFEDIDNKSSPQIVFESNDYGRSNYLGLIISDDYKKMEIMERGSWRLEPSGYYVHLEDKTC